MSVGEHWSQLTTFLFVLVHFFNKRTTMGILFIVIFICYSLVTAYRPDRLDCCSLSVKLGPEAGVLIMINIVYY